MNLHFSLHCAGVQGHNRTTAGLGGLRDVDWKSCLASYQLVGVWTERVHQQRLRRVASWLQPQGETADAVLPADRSAVRQGSASRAHSATGVRRHQKKTFKELQGKVSLQAPGRKPSRNFRASDRTPIQ